MIGAMIAGRHILGVPWTVAFVPILLIGVVAVAVIGRQSDPGTGPQPAPASSSTASAAVSAGGQIPDLLFHSWQRPYAVTPNTDRWGTAFLAIAGGILHYGPEPGPAASSSAITAMGADTLEVTATAETQGCAIGDIGAYRWTVEGKATVLTLTAISADACAAREKALAGPWVRSDLPAPGNGEPTLPPGTYMTSAFDPFDRPGIPGQLSYTVPEGWNVIEDQPADLVLHHPSGPSPSQSSSDVFIALFAQPRMTADPDGMHCGGPPSDAPGIGHRVDDIVAAIRAHVGVISTPPAAVTIGGYDGQMLDLRLAPTWISGCQAPEGTVVGIPLLHHAGSETGPVAGVAPDHPLRLILLDLTAGQTMAVAIFGVDPGASQVAAVMPVIESFRFHAPAP